MTFVLTDGVADLETVFGGPVVVDFGVVGRRDNPVFVSTNLELEGGGREMTKPGENHHHRKQINHVAVEVRHLEVLFQKLF